MRNSGKKKASREAFFYLYTEIYSLNLILSI